MSSTLSAQPEFDFWEFVSCARCQLPFVSGAVPFWLTECGHVICNNHLNHDQSCAQCGARGIQLIPLQREMEPPMSEWFRSVPYILDAAAYAAKFQQESMAAQIRSLKARYQQQRLHIEQLKRENTELRQKNEVLTAEVAQIRQNSYGSSEPSAFVNHNGKRPMTESFQPSTSSSPNFATVPMGPSRITLPPGQKPPHLSSKHEDRSSASEEYHSAQEMAQRDKQAFNRPGSSRFAQQYTYVSSADPQTRPNHQSQDPQTRPDYQSRAQSRQLQRARLENQQDHPQTQSSRPVTPLTKFKPPSVGKHYRAMGPPPTPQHVRTTRPPPTETAALPNNRFQPTSQGLQTSTPVNPKEFITPTSARMPFPTSNTTGSRAPSRAHPNLCSSSGQRVPFVPR